MVGEKPPSHPPVRLEVGIGVGHPDPSHPPLPGTLEAESVGRVTPRTQVAF